MIGWLISMCEVSLCSMNCNEAIGTYHVAVTFTICSICEEYFSKLVRMNLYFVCDNIHCACMKTE